MYMERFTRTYSVIHLDSINYNIDQVKKQIKPDTKILAIVKANAYGHGALRIAAEIKDKVYGFGVATVKEALELRNSGIDNFILVLGYVTSYEYEEMITNNITFTIATREMAEDISRYAVKFNKEASCHIKINTGMNRLGFSATEETINEIISMHSLSMIKWDGIFMHFATADEENKDYSKKQFERFSYVLDKLEKNNITFPIRHCANSATIIDMPEYQLDMVREGIVLYGLLPSDEVKKVPDFKPVMEIKSHVIFVNELAAGESISYGRCFVTDRDMRVATIAIGYADGYPRALSNKGYVLIHGQKAAILGRVCMDQMVVDVTDIEDVKVEDVVTIVGKDGGAEITIEELSELSGRFNYEFVCDISERVEKKYI